jgi:pimeloyl-ACP methyl ester carboxylesterase
VAPLGKLRARKHRARALAIFDRNRSHHWDWRRLALAAALATLAAIATDETPAMAEPSASAIVESELCKTHWTIGDAWLPYCRNERIGESREHVQRAVIVVHGTNRNARSYFEVLERLAREESRGSETLLFGLQFLTPDDTRALGLPAQYLTWSSDGWKHGLKSTGEPGISSFEVLDRFLSRLIQQNPNLQRITIAGHSAGGQLVQRHALGRKLDVSGWPGQLHYVVTNPGTYMYLTPDRPASTSGCKTTYNDYRYGYDNNRLEYFQGTSPDSLWRNLASQRVSILLGKRDTETAEIDQSCPALSQGKNRFERGKSFHQLTLKHLPAHFSPSDLARFQLHLIPAVGHEFERMWDSRCGRDLLFGRGSCSAAPPPSAAFPI